MTDFEYDCRQKKNIARSASHKKNGSRSKYCSLPHDHLTKKELKALNGEVVTHNINSPLNWTGFSRLPVDLKKQYLETLVETYGVSAKQIAEMFEVNPSSLSRGVRTIPGFSFRVRKRQTQDQMDAWQRFLSGATEPTEQSSEPEQPRVTPAETDSPEPEEEPVNAENKKDRQEPAKRKPYHFRIMLDCENLHSVSGLIVALQSLEGADILSVHMDWQAPSEPQICEWDQF